MLWSLVAIALATEPTLVLPPGQDLAAWAGPAALAGFCVGAHPGGDEVELIAGADGWTLVARDGRGAEKWLSIATPTTAQAREDTVWLGASLLASLPSAPSSSPSSAAPSASLAAAPSSAVSTTPGPARAVPAGRAPSPDSPAPGPPNARALPSPSPKPATVHPAPVTTPPVTTAPITTATVPDPRGAAPSPTDASTPTVGAEPTAKATTGSGDPNAASPAAPAPQSVATSPAASSPAPPSVAASPAPPSVAASPAPAEPPAPADPAAPNGAPPAENTVTSSSSSTADRSAPRAPDPSVGVTTPSAPRAGWVSAGPGVELRPDHRPAAAAVLEAGLRLTPRVWTGVSARWGSAQDLTTVPEGRLDDNLTLSAGLFWSPELRLAPWMGGSFGLSNRGYFQGEREVDHFWMPLLAGELGLVAHTASPLTLRVAGRVSLDTTATEVVYGENAPFLLSPWGVGAVLSAGAEIR